FAFQSPRSCGPSIRATIDTYSPACVWRIADSGEISNSPHTGIGMNARGGMEIIVALIGLSLGVLTQEMYAIIVMVAIITSLMTPPLLSWMLSGVEPKPEETARLEREKLLARLPFTREGAKLLVLSGSGPHAQLAAHLAAALGNHHDASIT